MNLRFQVEKIYGPTLIFLGVLALMSFQNCAKPGIETTVGKSNELSSTVSGPLSVTQSGTDQNSSMKFSCTPGKTLTVYQSSRASSNKTCQDISANVVCPQGGSFGLEGYSSLHCGITCSGSSTVVRYKDKNKSCSDSQNRIEKSCVSGYADISSDFDQTECKADPQAKLCSILEGGVDSGAKISSGAVAKKYLYANSLDCNDTQLSPSEEKTCGADGADLNFSNGYTNGSCTTLDKTQLVHYVRIIYKDRLIKIHRYNYSSNEWVRTVVWDGNKKVTYPAKGDENHQNQRNLFNTIGTRISSTLYLDKDSAGNTNTNTDLYQKADTSLTNLLGQAQIGEKGTYVESIIDVSDLDLANNAKKFSAYDYGLMYPDLTEYLAKNNVMNSERIRDFTANPWVIDSNCNSLYTHFSKTDGVISLDSTIDWSVVYADSKKAKIAYECAYKTLYAVFGPNYHDGRLMTNLSQDLVAQKNFTAKFVNGSGSEYDLFLTHYTTSSDAYYKAGQNDSKTPCTQRKDSAGKPIDCEFRNPNLFFDNVAYYYQYISNGSVCQKADGSDCKNSDGSMKIYGEIYTASDTLISNLSGLGFFHYSQYGIAVAGSTVGGITLSKDVVALPFVPRFDEVLYLQEYSDVLKSVYMHTLNPSDTSNLQSGSSHYMKWGRGELRRGFYLKQSMY